MQVEKILKEHLDTCLFWQQLTTAESREKEVKIFWNSSVMK